MENSDSTVANQEASYRNAVLRAVLSAATFGTLGALVGRWLGRHGNDRTSKMAEPTMMWSMGIFAGLLGAYSSLKVTQREASQHSHVSAANDGHAEASLQTAEKTNVSHASYDGKVVHTGLVASLEK